MIFHKNYLLKKSRALSQLLEWAFLEKDGVIVLKNGAMMSVYACKGVDENSLSLGELEHCREILKNALMKMGGDWACSLDLVRVPVDLSDYPAYQGSDSGAMLDRAHRDELRSHGLIDTCFYFTLVKHPLLTSSQNKDLGSHTEFVKERDALAECFSQILSLKLLQALGDDKFDPVLSFLRSCFEGSQKKCAAPHDTSAPLDSWICTKDFQTGQIPCIGDCNLALVSVDSYPAQTSMSMLEAVAALPFPCRFSSRFICFDNLRSSLALKRKRRFFEQRRRGFVSQILNVQDQSGGDRDAIKQIDDIDEAIGSLSSRGQSFGALSQVLVIPSKDLKTLEKNCAQAVCVIEDLGFGARVETVNATEAFLGSLPGDLTHNLRRPLINSAAVADLLPIFSPWHGESSAPCPLYREKEPLLQALSPDESPFFLNLHTGDLGNTLVSGPPGSGKSVLLNALILSLMRYSEMKIWAFERGFSLYVLCKKLEGEHVMLDGSVSLSPLRYLEDAEDLSRARNFIRTLCTTSGERLSASAEKCLNDALALLATKSHEERTLSDLMLLCSGSSELCLALEPHLKRSGGGILDGNEDPGFKQKLTVFECAALLERPHESTHVLRHLLGRIRRECEKDIHPKAVILDEAWLMLQDETFCHELISWLKTLRKHNTLVVLATQSLADLDLTHCAEAVFDCIKTRIYLPNPDASQAIFKPRYIAAGLNDSQIGSIAQAIPKRDLFIQKPGHFSRFRLLLSQEELDVFTKSGAAALLDTAKSGSLDGDKDAA
ncbi:MAG: hypothetical protein MR571_03700 [Succinatimonas sp.]|nr:hypothetical protein [Succinatimonas sp.]